VAALGGDGGAVGGRQPLAGAGHGRLVVPARDELHRARRRIVRPARCRVCLADRGSLASTRNVRKRAFPFRDMASGLLHSDRTKWTVADQFCGAVPEPGSSGSVRRPGSVRAAR
jgi:hypothetical protein